MFDEYDEIMTIPEVCEALLVGKNTVYKLIDNGQLSYIRIGKVYKINKCDLKEYIRRASGLHFQ